MARPTRQKLALGRVADSTTVAKVFVLSEGHTELQLDFLREQYPRYDWTWTLTDGVVRKETRPEFYIG